MFSAINFIYVSLGMGMFFMAAIISDLFWMEETKSWLPDERFPTNIKCVFLSLREHEVNEKMLYLQQHIFATIWH